LQYYRGNAKVASCIQTGLEGFRQVPTRYVGRQKIDIDVVLGGDFSTAQEQKIASSVLPAITKEESLVYANAARGNGDALFKAKDYLAARCKYSIAAYRLGENIWKSRYDCVDWSRITTEHKPLLLRTFIGGFRAASKLGQFDSALSLINFVEFRR
jgi:hypothetical protein